MSVFNYKFKIEDYKVKDSHRFNEKNLSDFLSDKLTEFSSSGRSQCVSKPTL